MIELLDKADRYASGKSNAIIDKAIAQAYADGYRDGYADREKDILVDLRDGSTKYVDLGLPSGTLWSTDYLKENNKCKYLPFSKAESLCLPTEKQWNELVDICKWEYEIDSIFDLSEARCIGPSGNFLRFEITGKKNTDSNTDFREVFFWIKDSKEGFEKNAVHMYYSRKENVEKKIETFFTGYKLPIRLVKTK